jgi:hypothetical protein
MSDFFVRFKERWWTPFGIICVVVFIVLPIILAMPLVIWLTRQIDRLPTWRNAGEPATPHDSRTTEGRLGHEQVRLGQGGDAAVILVTAAVERDGLDALRRGARRAHRRLSA